MEKSFVHIYTGDGKGKTTAAAGLAVRAIGSGRSVKFVQFLKGRPTGEMKILNELEGAEFFQVSSFTKFFPDMTQQEQQQVIKETQDFLPRVFSWLGEADVLVLDESLGVLSLGILNIEQIKRIINERKDTEIVLTGRNAPKELIDIADVVTEMKAVKHYYDKGVLARKGIEF